MTGIFAWILIWIMAKRLFIKSKSFIHKLPFEHLMTELLEKEDSFKALLPFIDEKLTIFFNQTIKEKLPIIAMFIGEKTIVQLKAVFIEELTSILPSLIHVYSQTAKRHLIDTINNKLTLAMEHKLMKAIRPYQWMALVGGMLWGILMVFLQHLIK